MPDWLSYFTPAFFVGLVAIVLVEVSRRIAIKLDFVYRPVSDRWNRRTVPMGGGVALHLSLLLGLYYFDREMYQALKHPIQALILFGIADDIVGFMPLAKLGFQALVAWHAVKAGYCLNIGPEYLNIAASILWILFVTNAVNLNDNMDGLASGLMVISNLGLAILLTQAGFPEGYRELALLTAGVAAGFLVHNFHPARIFMGDGGSLPFGFIVSILTLKLGSSNGWVSILQMPLVLLLPIFDSLFVMALRARDGKAVMKGGIDHCSHRLVQGGVDEWGSVSVLHTLNLVGVLAALALNKDRIIGSGAIAIAALIYGYFAYVILRAEKNLAPRGPVALFKSSGVVYAKLLSTSRKTLDFLFAG